MEIKKVMKNIDVFGEDLKYTKGALHCHTENSVDDGVQSVLSLCQTAKDLGATAAVISDHGTSMGWTDFDEAAKRVGIKPIFGIEAYYIDEEINTRAHLILYAKNQKGWQQINLAMSRANTDDNVPCLTAEILEEYLTGGNVIATSACIQGPFGAPYLYNKKIERKIKKLEDEIVCLEDSMSIYAESKKRHKELLDQVSLAKADVSEAKKKKSFAGKVKTLSRKKEYLQTAEAAFDNFVTDPSDKNEKAVKRALAKLDIVVEDNNDFQQAIEDAKLAVAQMDARLSAEMKDAEQMAASLPEKEAIFEKAKQLAKEEKANFDAVAKDVAKAENKIAKIEELQMELLSKERIAEIQNKRFAVMKKVFGDNFYMEVQNHGIDVEAEIYPHLAQIARKAHIKLVAANDAHVSHNNHDDFVMRQIRRSCRFKKWETEIDGDEELYIKNDRELALALCQILPDDMVMEAMSNVAKIIDECNVTIEVESHAPKAKLLNPQDEIMRLARANITKKYGNRWGKEHEERLVYETNIIHTMGFDDYFVITCDILDIARLIGGLSYENLDYLKSCMNEMTLDHLLKYLQDNSNEVNLSVGLGRGSGAGSLVCYLLGITNIDPFKYDLLFERFLNPERISMPDIDSDFRTDIKDVLLVYLKKKYGERAIAQILTKSYLHGKSAIDKVVMILGDRDGKDYRWIGEKLKKKPGIDFTAPMIENREAMMVDANSDIEKEIVEDAILMDNNLDHTGLHAAAVIISDNDDLAEYIPVAWDTGFQTWKTQCDMVQCEKKYGLLKMDLLLLKTLDIVTYALRLIKQTHPDVDIDIENLPMEREVFEKIYAAGDTKSVFQFESGGMVKFLRQLKPTCMEDIIAANAMYRPGPMDSATRFGV